MKNYIYFFLIFALLIISCNDSDVTNTDDNTVKTGDVKAIGNQIESPGANFFINGKFKEDNAQVNVGQFCFIMLNDSIYFYYNDGRDTKLKLNKESSKQSFLKFILGFNAGNSVKSKVLNKSNDKLLVTDTSYSFKTGLDCIQYKGEFTFTNNKIGVAGFDLLLNEPPNVYCIQSKYVRDEISFSKESSEYLNILFNNGNKVFSSYNIIRTFSSPLRALFLDDDIDNILSEIAKGKNDNNEYFEKIYLADALSMFYEGARLLLEYLGYLGYPTYLCNRLENIQFTNELKTSTIALVNSGSANELPNNQKQFLESAAKFSSSILNCFYQNVCVDTNNINCKLLKSYIDLLDGMNFDQDQIINLVKGSNSNYPEVFIDEYFYDGKTIIKKIVPEEAYLGDEITIYGHNLLLYPDNPDKKVVFSYQVDASDIIYWDQNEIRLKVPYGAQTGRVEIIGSGTCNLRNIKIKFRNPKEMESVKIGNQIWSKKNLDVTHYRNGDPIPQVDPKEWIGMKTGAWCYYNNDPANNEIYGKLYNWGAVMDPRGLAPEGWHVPTIKEWDELKNFLDKGDNGGRLLKDTGFVYWNYHRVYGGLDKYGFKALPSGAFFYPNFQNMGTITFFWSKSSYDYRSPLGYQLTYDSPIFKGYFDWHYNGNPVRCIKDE